MTEEKPNLPASKSETKSDVEANNRTGGEDSVEIKSAEENSGNITSPEGILMLIVAGIIDGIGFIIFILGAWFAIDDYGILDILGMIIIGGWMYLKSSSNSSAVKKGLKRFITSSVVELIPFLGGASPSWTWLVYKTLKDG